MSSIHRTIEVVISPAGEVTVQTRGFTGENCREASLSIEAALGARVAERLTAEFYQAESVPQQRAKQHG
jgi:hypothetical protein